MIEAGRGMGLINGKGTCTSSSIWERMEKYFYMALDKGWHVGPTAGQDDHSKKWGTTNPARTVVLAENLTRDDIYDALRNMRFYASEDKNLQLRYTLNDSVMGSIVKRKSDKVELKVQYKEINDDQVDYIRVMVDGQKEIKREYVDNSEGNLTFSLPSNYSYYVVELYEKDNDFAITAPVWVEDAKFDITKFEAQNSDYCNIGDRVNLNALVKDAEGDVKYKFYAKDEEGNISIIKDYSEASTVQWVPSKASKYTLYVEAKDDSNSTVKSIPYTVMTEPNKVIIYYKGYSSPNIHYKIASGNWTTVPGIAMEKSDDINGFSYKAEVNLGAEDNITCCFNDGKGNWDNNSKANYVFKTGCYTFDNGTIKAIDNPNVKLEIKNIITDKISPQIIGNNISITALATGKGKIQYKIELYENGKKILASKCAETNCWNWRPNENGEYALKVFARDESGKIVTKTMKYIIDSNVELCFKKITVNCKSPQKVNTAIEINAKTMGAGTVRYVFLIYKDGKQVEKSTSVYSNKYIWKPSSAGKYIVKVMAKDRTGKVISKYTNFLIN